MYQLIRNYPIWFGIAYVVVSIPIFEILTQQTSNLIQIVVTAFFVSIGILWFNFSLWKALDDFLNNKSPAKDEPKLLRLLFMLAALNFITFSFPYYVFGIVAENAIIKGDWLASLYFSIVTFTTLGYGDFQPIPQLRLVASIEALLGYIYLATAIGCVIPRKKSRGFYVK